MKHVLLLGIFIFSLTGCDTKDDGAVVGKTLCDFGVVLSDAKLVPVDPLTHQAVGIFERWPDGRIQLTTPGGYAPDVTECLKNKGYSHQSEFIPAYEDIERPGEQGGNRGES